MSYPAITDPGLNITVAFRPDTFLPYLIRSYENHSIYGRSSNDYVVSNYTTVAGVKFPRRIKVVYNEDNLLVDTLIGDVKINPPFPLGFFDGLPESQINQTAFKSPPVPAEPSKQYDEAEVFENRLPSPSIKPLPRLMTMIQPNFALGWWLFGEAEQRISDESGRRIARANPSPI